MCEVDRLANIHLDFDVQTHTMVVTNVRPSRHIRLTLKHVFLEDLTVEIIMQQQTEVEVDRDASSNQLSVGPATESRTEEPDLKWMRT